MFKLLCFVTICIIYNFEQYVAERIYRPPVDNDLYTPYPRYFISGAHITNMTTRLLKDMEAKMEIAYYIRDAYKDHPLYDLGSIVAELQTCFKYMMMVYKKFAYLPTHAEYSIIWSTTYAMHDLLNAYASIHSCYNQIRLNGDIFRQIMKNYAKLKEMESKQTKPEHADAMDEDLKEYALEGGGRKHFNRGLLAQKKKKSDAAKTLWKYKPDKTWFPKMY